MSKKYKNIVFSGGSIRETIVYWMFKIFRRTWDN